MCIVMSELLLMTSHKPGVPNLGRETSFFSAVCCSEKEAVDNNCRVKINNLDLQSKSKLQQLYLVQRNETDRKGLRLQSIFQLKYSQLKNVIINWVYGRK